MYDLQRYINVKHNATIQNKMQRCWPDEGWDTTNICIVLVPTAGAGPCAGHAGTKAGVLPGIGARPAKVIFDQNKDGWRPSSQQVHHDWSWWKAKRAKRHVEGQVGHGSYQVWSSVDGTSIVEASCF